MDCDESLVKAQTITQTHTDSPHQDQEELNLYAGREATCEIKVFWSFYCVILHHF